jgi:hypothetical protein
MPGHGLGGSERSAQGSCPRNCGVRCDGLSFLHVAGFDLLFAGAKDAPTVDVTAGRFSSTRRASHEPCAIAHGDDLCAVGAKLTHKSSTIENRARTKQGGLHMSEKIGSEAVSRRSALSFLGLATASSLTILSSVLAASDAEARTVGMVRRQTRRVARRAGRYTRRAVRRGYY